MAQTWDQSTLKADAGGSEFKGSSDCIGRLRLIILFDIIKTYLLNNLRAKNAIHWYNAGLYELSLWLIYIIEGKQKQPKIITAFKITSVFLAFVILIAYNKKIVVFIYWYSHLSFFVNK